MARYSKAAKKEVKKVLKELKQGKLTTNKRGGKKIKSRKWAIAKALNIADSRVKYSLSKRKRFPAKRRRSF